MRIFKGLVKFVRNLAVAWDEDKPARLAAGIAYYSLFSLAPLIYVAITVAGIFIDEAQIIDQLYARVGELFGPETVETLASSIAALEASATSSEGIIASIIGILVLVFAASGLFTNLKYALNSIWQIPPSEYAGLLAFIKTRLIALLIVIGFGLLLVLIAFTGVIISLLNNLSIFDLINNYVNSIVIYLLAIFTFALFYKILPDTHVGWRDVWGGAIFAVTLITMGLWLVGLFFGSVRVTSATGAAGAVAVLLLAVYYLTQIFLVGSEFTKVYAYMYGTRKHERPNKYLHTVESENDLIRNGEKSEDNK